MPHSDSGVMARQWAHQAETPIRSSPFFERPLSPRRMAAWFASRWLRPSENLVVAALAVLCWMFLQPPLETVKTLSPGWIAAMYARNFALMTLIAGGLHLYLYTFGRQGGQDRFDARPLRTDARGFTFKNQVFDNMFWTLASGVTVWTAYEALMLWALANGYAPMLDWREHPVLFVLWLLATPVWISFHFFWIHRLLHWPPLYRFHALHHRNINVGPWSGFSMHPVEHIIFLSSVLIHWVIGAHPLHILFHLQHQALTAASSHAGFESLYARGKKVFPLGMFHHQIHHRYFECNYGNLEFPADRWASTYHDGCEDSHTAMQARLRARRPASAVPDKE